MRPDAERDTVVTGLGAVCALAEDCDGLWEAMAAHRCGIAPLERFPTDGFSVRLGALVERWAAPQASSRDLTGDLCRRFAGQALGEALRSAGIDERVCGARVALVFGTGIADLQQTVHEIAEELADECGIRGPRLTVSTACSSSTAAIALGRDLLVRGDADVVLAGGADVLTPEVFAGFHALGVLCHGRCAPFSTPAGTTLGEGAGFLVLEQRAHAAARGATPCAGLSGCGLSGDGWHETSPDPKGAGVERAIRSALADASLDAADIDYVNAHGSGTEANDLSEWLGIQRALGARARSVPVSSSKGALGHAQGAAGALEAIVTLLAAERDAVPPTFNFAGARAQSPADPVPGPAPRPARWAHALKLNSAFGGSNASLVISRPAATRPALPRAAVCLLGIGAVGPRGLGAGAFATDDGTEGPRRAALFGLEKLVPDADPRGLDPASRLLTAAAAASLRDARLAVRGPLRDRAGLLVGQLRGSPASIVAFQRSIEERGLPQLSPTAFARIVLNAAAGACSKLLSLRGPLSAITTGEGSGLAAILLAAELLGTRADADVVVAGGVDEHAPSEVKEVATHDEGAACVVLANARGAANTASQPVAWLTEWAFAGPGRLGDAIARVLAPGRARSALASVRVEDMRGGAGASGALAIERAASMLRDDDIDDVLVTLEAGRSISAALVLSRSAPVT